MFKWETVFLDQTHVHIQTNTIRFQDFLAKMSMAVKIF